MSYESPADLRLPLDECPDLAGWAHSPELRALPDDEWTAAVSRECRYRLFLLLVDVLAHALEKHERGELGHRELQNLGRTQAVFARLVPALSATDSDGGEDDEGAEPDERDQQPSPELLEAFRRTRAVAGNGGAA